MAVDQLSIINAALSKLGSRPILALDEDTTLASQAVTAWDDLVEAGLGLWLWTWPRRTRALDQVAETPIGYAYSYAWPAEAVAQPVALFENPARPNVRLRQFSVEGRKIYCDAAALYGRFPCLVDPSEWPASYRLFFTTWLAAHLAVPVGHDQGLKDALMIEAIGLPSEGGRGGLLGRAIGLDHAGDGDRAPLNATDVLTEAHWGGGGDGWSGGAAW